MKVLSCMPQMIGRWTDYLGNLQEWFHISLVDSDLAINSMMWQHQGLTGATDLILMEVGEGFCIDEK